MVDDRLDKPSSNYDVPRWTAGNNKVGWRAIHGDAAEEMSSAHTPQWHEPKPLGQSVTYPKVGPSEVF